MYSSSWNDYRVVFGCWILIATALQGYSKHDGKEVSQNPLRKELKHY